ncbi:MAG: RHS repeat-associated core domain-containing protein, partial [Betaproteobacteria bacterium]
LNDIRPLLDIDGNGQADALTDGLMIIRYLFGLRGASLIGGAVGPGATRTTAPAVETLLVGISTVTAALPPDPATVAPPTDPTITTTLIVATGFLYTGPNPIQTGVAPGTIQAQRAAVLRGKVQSRDGAPLPGVTLTILNHPEFGQTLSRADGAFDLAVNGGSALTVNYQKTGFLPVQRQLYVPWQDFTAVPDVVMIPLDAAVTPINLNAGAMQVARGNTMSDVDGSRRATLLVPSGTTANLVMPNGTTQPITALNVRATEYTVGANGPQAMPGALPPTSGYTYAIELSADEAIAAGAKSVTFSSPLPYYLENFLGFPVGGAVPVGYYDRVKTAWVPSLNGRVIKIMSIAGGIATVDTVGSGGLTPINLSVAERTQLASLYAVNQELWRVPIPHFTPWDCNWPYGPPADAVPPKLASPSDTGEVDDPTCSGGSIIECENQTLGERIGLVGVPYSLNYRSTRVPGRVAGRALDINLSGASLPASVKRIDLEVQVAGKSFKQSFPTTLNQKTSFVWDGVDAYGRPMQGAQPASVSIGYVYDAVYLAPANLLTSFGAFGGNVISGNRAASEVTLTQRFASTIGAFDMRAIGLGGWTLASHHVYDVAKGIIHLGDGTRRTAGRIGTVLETMSFRPNDIRDIVAAPDGSVYLASNLAEQIVYRVAPDGTFTIVAGNGVPGGSTFLTGPTAIALAPDGSLYIAETFAHRIRRVTPAGGVSIVAGTGASGFSGDGGLATAATFSQPSGLAVAADGSLFIADWGNFRIRRVRTDGFINTIAGGTGTCGLGFSCGDGGQAILAGINAPRGIAFGPDGSLFVAEDNTSRIRRIGPDGIITTFAGTTGGFSGDGGPATAARIHAPSDVDVAPDGGVYIADFFNGSVRYVGTDGVISTVAGTGISLDGIDINLTSGRAPAAVTLGKIRGVSVGANGKVYFGDSDNSYVFGIAPALPGLTLFDSVVPSSDGQLLFHFNENGRHLRTRDARTGASLLEFVYGATGRLNQIVEKTGGTDNVTTINHDANGNPTSIIAPFGQGTVLGVDSNGFLASITNPATEAIQITYSAAGLLQSFTDPRGKTSQYGYDSLGRLIQATDPAGGVQTLARTELANGYSVARTTALARTTTYKVETLATGDRKRTSTMPGGETTQLLSKADGTNVFTRADGTVITTILGPDPRFGMLAPFASTLSIATPGGLVRQATTSMSASLSDPANPLSLVSLTRTSTVNGRTRQLTYTAATRTHVTTTPTGRNRTWTIDALGRLATSQTAGIEPVNFTYDSRGRLATVTQASGPGSRTLQYVYNAQGFVQTLTDPIGRNAQFTYDAAGRVLSRTSPDGRVVSYNYDAAGNVSGVTPPSRPAHTFAYSNRNELTLETPPSLPGTGPKSYAFDADRMFTEALRADNRTLTIGYDAAGRPVTRTLATNGAATGTDTTSYDAAGRVTNVAAASGIGTGYSYDGAFTTGEAWTGAVAGSVARSYDAALRFATQSVNGANTIGFNYDNDDLLLGVGAMTFTRNAQNGLPTGSSLGVGNTATGYNSFGELASYAVTSNGSPVFDFNITRDGLGRISQRAETLAGLTDNYVYAFDTAGQLTGVSRNGVAVETYGYDSNGNRTSATVQGLTVTGTYDAQDRLTQYGGASYTYNGAGDLSTRTLGGQTTTYQYDQPGNLRSVTLPNATTIDYIIDGNDRRVGKKINGTLVKGFLYNDSLRPVAELDAPGNVVSRFVYGYRRSPAYMVKGGVNFRIVTDHLGSVRLVVDAATGAVAQRIDYDSFGNVIQDTNPGFQPFGFAGGLYDADTGLVRFGARDYDATTGRWTAKDPIGFGAGDSNVYRYVRNDPLNYIDSSGTQLEELERRLARLVEAGKLIAKQIHPQRLARMAANRAAREKLAAEIAIARRGGQANAGSPLMCLANYIDLLSLGVTAFQNDHSFSEEIDIQDEAESAENAANGVTTNISCLGPFCMAFKLDGNGERLEYDPISNTYNPEYM